MGKRIAVIKRFRDADVRRSCGSAPYYPWRDLTVGDWFLVPNITKQQADSIGASGVSIGRPEGKKFSRHRVEGGYEFKRIA
jgi:hypothetical protein